jgi:Cdc6-like AAA superfamily ATPase
MYGLEKAYLTPNPRAEARAFVGPRRATADSFVEHVSRIIKIGRVPKAVLWGAFGTGKTHFGYYVGLKLAEIARVVYVECPPCHRRTKYSDLHAAIMRKIGREYALGLFEQTIREANRTGKPLAEALGLDQDLTAVIRGGFGSDRTTLWRYLSGERLGSREVRLIDAISPQIREDDAVAIVNSIAKLVRSQESKQLFIMIDEFENTHALLGDSLMMFIGAVRGLVDESSEVGVVFIASVRSLDEMPFIIVEDPVRRRIGLTNFMEYKEYTRKELEELIHQLIEFRRVKGFSLDQVLKEDIGNINENITAKTYPFTQEAIILAIDKVFELRESGDIPSIRPKESLDLLDYALATGVEDETAVLGSEFVEQALAKYPLSLESRF